MAKQLGFKILGEKAVKVFGGDLLRNSNPKSKRIITTKRSMHLVMRSSLAKGRYSFLRNDARVRRIIQSQGKLAGVKVYGVGNGGNHLHLTILPQSRAAFKRFVRAVSGIIAREILGAERGRGRGLKFWDKRPFTRVLEWGREFRKVSGYLHQNTLEAFGFIPFQPRGKRLKLVESTA